MNRGYGALFLLSVVVVGLMSCEEKIKPSVLPGIDSQTLPQQESWNSKIVLSDSGKLKAIIYAGYVRVYASPPRTQISDGMTVHFYQTNGNESSVLTSQEGTVHDDTKNLTASGNVLVVSSDTTKLWTEKLDWDNKRQLIHTTQFVRIHSPKERLQGYGFESDQHLRRYRIYRVSGESVSQ